MSPLVAERIAEYRDLLAMHDIECHVLETDHHLSEAEVLEVVDGYDGVIAEDDEFTERVLRRADRLSVISKCGVGLDSVDLAAAEALDVRVLNTPGVYSDEVADVVLGYAVMLARDLLAVDRGVREGAWPDARGVSLSGVTFGVVGVGDIGSAVARRAAAFGMEVLGHDVDPIPESLQEGVGVEPVDRRELFERSQFVSLHCPLTPETAELVGEGELSCLGSDGYLINTARGGLVDESALVDAVESEAIAGAALDVFRTEPLPADHPFTTTESVVLGSHNAYNTHEAVDRVVRRTVENLVGALE